MEFRYVLLKSSWGIVVFLDMEEVLDFEINDQVHRVTDNIYIQFDGQFRLRYDIAEFWLVRALGDLAPEISKKLKGKKVCYSIKKIDFDHVHFQEEGIYCAVQGWIAKYYNIEIPEVEVFYDKQKNKYIFPTLISRE